MKMRFYWPVEISGVKNVVINRMHVWERINNDHFCKVAGGPGFVHNKVIPTYRMLRLIDNQVNYYVRQNIPLVSGLTTVRLI